MTEQIRARYLPDPDCSYIVSPYWSAPKIVRLFKLQSAKLNPKNLWITLKNLEYSNFRTLIVVHSICHALNREMLISTEMSRRDEIIEETGVNALNRAMLISTEK